MSDLPTFEFEQKLWDKGMQLVAGVDEVGRGCFAGPVTAGCVIFSPEFTSEQLEDEAVEINDSKKMKHKKRKASTGWIKENAMTWGIGSASVTEINKIGVGKAANRAFRRAILSAEKRGGSKIEFLLVDAFYIPYTSGLPIGPKLTDLKDIFDSNSRQLAVKRGDSRSLSIAAASIIAKEHRDSLMRSLGRKKKYKKYGWGSNKGYASKQHRNAIIEHGITKHHRRQFVNTFLENRGLETMSNEQ